MKSKEIEFHVHVTDQKKWEPIDQVDEDFLCALDNHLFFTSNGIFYVHKIVDLTGVLYAYDISSNLKFLGFIRLPKFEYMDMENSCTDKIFIVPVDDFEFYFLWHKVFRGRSNEIPLHYAKFSVSLSPPNAALLEQGVLCINAQEVTNCLPYASFPGDRSEVGKENCVHTSETQVKEIYDACSYKQELKQVDWKIRCMYLEEKLREKEGALRRTQERLRETHERLQRAEQKQKHRSTDQIPSAVRLPHRKRLKR